MYTKEFNQFVWKEELKILDLSYFYLGSLFLLSLYYLFPSCFKIDLLTAFFFLASGIGMSLTVFIGEHLTNKCLL